MKKVMSIVLACVLLVSMMVLTVVPVSAATPKEDIIAAIKANIPAEYVAKHLPTLENVLQQIEVTAEQAEAVVKNIEAAKASVKEDKGDSLSEYAKAERDVIVAEFGKACETLGVEYEIKPAEKPTHEGDVDVVVKVENKVIASVDGDAVKKTNAPERTVNYALVVLAGVLVAAAVVVATRCNKATSC